MFICRENVAALINNISHILPICLFVFYIQTDMERSVFFIHLGGFFFFFSKKSCQCSGMVFVDP